MCITTYLYVFWNIELSLLNKAFMTYATPLSFTKSHYAIWALLNNDTNNNILVSRCKDLPVCVRLWIFRWAFWVKRLWHMWHSKGRLSAWGLMSSVDSSCQKHYEWPVLYQKLRECYGGKKHCCFHWELDYGLVKA